MEMGLKLRKARMDRGLKAKDVAEKIGITSSSLSDMEHDRSKPSYTNLGKLSKLYNIPIAYFVSEEETLGMLIDSKINQLNLSYEEKEKIADKLIDLYKLMQQ